MSEPLNDGSQEGAQESAQEKLHRAAASHDAAALRIISLDELREKWQAVMGHFRERAGVGALAYLSDAAPVEMSLDRVVFEWSREFHYEKACEAARRIPFQEVLNEVLNHPRQLTFKLAIPAPLPRRPLTQCQRDYTEIALKWSRIASENLGKKQFTLAAKSFRWVAYWIDLMAKDRPQANSDMQLTFPMPQSREEFNAMMIGMYNQGVLDGKRFTVDEQAGDIPDHCEACGARDIFACQCEVSDAERDALDVEKSKPPVFPNAARMKCGGCELVSPELCSLCRKCPSCCGCVRHRI